MIALGVLCGVVGCFNPDTPAAVDTDAQSGTSSGGLSTTDLATSSSGPSVVDSSSGPAACEVCVPAPPEGWVGPLALGAGESIPSCVPPFTVIAFEAARDLAGEPASCECECGVADVDCGGVSLRYSNSNNCDPPPAGVENFMGPDTCHDTDPDGPRLTAFFFPVSGTEVCPATPTVSIPMATMTELILCGGGFDQDTCAADELCTGTAPEGFETTLCIAREGDFACPEAYPNASSAFTDVADDRRCTACECTPATDFECAADLELFAGPGCSGVSSISATDLCIDSPESFRFSQPAVTGSCSASETQPTGAIAGEDPITICCQ